VAPYFSSVVFCETAAVPVVETVSEVDVRWGIMLPEPSDLFIGDPRVDEIRRLGVRDVIRMDVLSYAFVERRPVEYARQDFLHVSPSLIQY